MPSLKDKLKEILTKKEISLLQRSFDIIGDIVVIEIPDELKKKEKDIAKAILEQHKNVKVVAKKVSKVTGEERIRKIKIILGEKRTKTIHKENGTSLHVDINKVYFSPRLSNERLRILELVKDKERIIDLFAGVGPYSILIAKNKKVVIDAVDINKSAYNYLVKNIELNKLKGKINPYHGDSSKIIKDLRKADRIIMNLPEKAIDFLDLASKKLKKDGTIHLYAFEEKGKVSRKLRKKGYKIVKKTSCGAFSPSIQRVCFEVNL